MILNSEIVKPFVGRAPPGATAWGAQNTPRLRRWETPGQEIETTGRGGKGWRKAERKEEEGVKGNEGRKDGRERDVVPHFQPCVDNRGEDRERMVTGDV